MANDVNIEDIGTAADPSLIPPPTIGTSVIPQLTAPIPIEAGGQVPQVPAQAFPSGAPTPSPAPPFQIVHPEQSIPTLPEPIQIGGPPPPMIRIAEPVGISAGGAHATPKRHLSSVPGQGQATNPDGLMAPDAASIREPTAVEKVAVAEDERAKLEDQMAQKAAEQADAEANAADARAKEQKRQIEEQDRFLAQQRDAMIEAKRVRDAAREETKNFKFHSPWANKSTGQKVLSGIAVLLGGVSWDQNHVNQAAEQISNNIARDFKDQESHLRTLQEDAQAKAGDVTDLARQHQEEWNKLKFKQGEQLIAVGNQFDVMALKAKGSQKVLEAKQLAQQYRATGQALIQNTEENIAKMHLTEAQTKHALASANEANALAHFHRITGGNAKADKAAAQDDTTLGHMVDTYAKQHNLVGEKGLGNEIQGLRTAYADAKAPVQNPLTQTTIMDKIITSATHLGARQKTFEMYKDKLGGLRAKGESKAQAWIDGTEGKRAWKTVVDHLAGALKERETDAKSLAENFDRSVGALPHAKRRPDTLAALKTGIFSMNDNAAPANASPANQPQSITTPDGKVHTLQGDGTYSK